MLCGKGLLRSDSDPTWYSPTSIAQLAALFTANSDSKFKLLAGDTGRGKSTNNIIHYALSRDI